MIKRTPRPLWHLVLSGLLVAVAIPVMLASQWHEHGGRDRFTRAAEAAAPPGLPTGPACTAAALRESLYSHVEPCLAELGVSPELISRHRSPDRPDLIVVRVPGDLPLLVVNHYLTRLTETSGGRVLRAEEKAPGRGVVEIGAGFDSVATTLFVLHRTPEIQRRTGRIAVVIDDFGYQRPDKHQLAGFCALPPQITFAVLPYARRMNTLLEAAGAGGRQVLLHLPMEATDASVNPGPDAIALNLDDEEIRQRVERALKRVPIAVGVNNHMGSRATADPRVMNAVLQVLHEHDLFFLDSVTTPESVGYALARDNSVPAARRNLFLDLVDDRAAVETQLWELADMASRMGAAIGIGHDRANTLLALQAILPRLRTRGFRLVPVSELVH